jgi:rubrerythrin
VYQTPSIRDFIGNIASAEMTHAVTERILRTVKAASKEITEDTGIVPSLTDLEIKEYLAEVINEAKNRKG